jgi:hypothetical protein
VILRGEKIKYFSCAREANLCVVVEEVEGKQILTTFDPVNGRGEKLPGDYAPFGRGILSPQGRIVEKMKAGPDGLYVRVRSLPKGPTEEVTFKNLTSTYQFVGWSLDGKGMYLYTGAPLRGTSVYAGLNGETHDLWKRGSGPGFWLITPFRRPTGGISPSRSGRMNQTPGCWRIFRRVASDEYAVFVAQTLPFPRSAALKTGFSLVNIQTRRPPKKQGLRYRTIAPIDEVWEALGELINARAPVRSGKNHSARQTSEDSVRSGPRA